MSDSFARYNSNIIISSNGYPRTSQNLPEYMGNSNVDRTSDEADAFNFSTRNAKLVISTPLRRDILGKASVGLSMVISWMAFQATSLQCSIFILQQFCRRPLLVVGYEELSGKAALKRKRRAGLFNSTLVESLDTRRRLEIKVMY